MLRVSDLRWGVTAESQRDNKTLTICLQMAEASDVFVGLQGRRYGTSHDRADASTGWVQQDVASAIDNGYQWLKFVACGPNAPTPHPLFLCQGLPRP